MTEVVNWLEKVKMFLFGSKPVIVVAPILPVVVCSNKAIVTGAARYRVVAANINHVIAIADRYLAIDCL
jgi:hypothetical protein